MKTWNSLPAAALLALTSLPLLVACGGSPVSQQAAQNVKDWNSGSGADEGAAIVCTGEPSEQPTVLATAHALDQNNYLAFDLKVDGTNVYWTDRDGPGNQYINAVPLYGGDATVLAEPPIASSMRMFNVQLGLTNSNIYYVTGSDSIYQIPITGGTPTVVATIPASDQCTPLPSEPDMCAPEISNIAVSDDALYFSAFVLGTYPNEGRLYSAPLATLSYSQPTQLFAGEYTPGLLTIGGDSIAWGDIGSVKAIPLAGGDVTTIAPNQQGVNFLAAADGQVYRANFAGPVVSSPHAPLPPPQPNWGTLNDVSIGGGPATVISTAYVVMGIATDDANVYWFESDTTRGAPATLKSAPLAGGPVSVLATNQDNRIGPVVDSTSVYWINGSGQIVKVAKSAAALCTP